ncbi:MAG: hypothetical protein AAGM22_28340 [Acidobacteriota bacterium]
MSGWRSGNFWLIVVTLAAALGLALSASGEPKDSGTIIFRGEYVWKVDNHKNRVEATFRDRGGGVYDVKFQFDYARRKDLVYEGQAQGDLQNGSVRGQVKGPNGAWRYAFEGTVEGDKLDGRHFDIWGGKKELSGTLSLERAVEGEVPDPDAEKQGEKN